MFLSRKNFFLEMNFQNYSNPVKTSKEKRQLNSGSV